MCRHVAWLGEPRTLASITAEPPDGPPYGLARQSYAPRRQAVGRLNADGWGIGWYAPDTQEPARWRVARPIWGDPSFASVAGKVSSHCILAAVRDASPGMPMDESACAPFTRGRWLLSHNGGVDRAVLPERAWREADSVCDAAILAAHIFEAPEELGARVAALGAQDAQARLNVLATDGDHILATAWGNTLSVLMTATGIAVASEPWDDDERWQDVPDRHLVTASRDGLKLTPLTSNPLEST